MNKGEDVKHNNVKVRLSWKHCGLPVSVGEKFFRVVDDNSTEKEIRDAWTKMELIPSYLNVFIEEFRYENIQKEEERKDLEREEDNKYRQELRRKDV